MQQWKPRELLTKVQSYIVIILVCKMYRGVSSEYTDIHNRVKECGSNSRLQRFLKNTL